MRDDLPAAALRLMASQTIHTHVRSTPADNRGDNMRRTHWQLKRGKKRVFTGLGRGSNQGRPLVIGARTFATMKAAKETFGIGNRTLTAWLDSGKARYA